MHYHKRCKKAWCYYFCDWSVRFSRLHKDRCAFNIIWPSKLVPSLFFYKNIITLEKHTLNVHYFGWHFLMWLFMSNILLFLSLWIVCKYICRVRRSPWGPSSWHGLRFIRCPAAILSSSWSFVSHRYHLGMRAERVWDKQPSRSFIHHRDYKTNTTKSTVI